MIRQKIKPCKCGKHSGYLFGHGYTKECWARIKNTGNPGRIQSGPEHRVFPPKKSLTPNKRKEFKQVPTIKSVHKAKKRQEYYWEAITANKNLHGGVCLCEECYEPIRNPRGINVCHIVGSGANELLYFDVRNRFILGKGAFYGQCECGVQFDDKGEKAKMKIYPRYVEIRTILNLEYYS